ncbi:sodium/myo-inositol cotransporter isoform X2 [Lingula anatina]|uniref:Sodium/myo-inositol cotransporter n=1 Tax=Lingula anatina TaxID=7574 RepID=A0A2R2MTM9_LINAN|nr:sodium/myo-inositol cotransporter isoform X2 [Lingula anatina]|eukprot:XP_023933473.1 sodium/myo-inositol cotransporter isoform X2 [Lingula anatina]
MATTADTVTMTTGVTDDNPYNLYPANEGLASWDLVVVAVYFCAVICVGIFAMCRASRGTVSGYFLAGRSMTFLPVGASLFVSNIGSEHFIGLAGSGAAGGIGVGAWEFNAILLLQLLGWVFIPVYIACGTYTMPEYLKKRFGGSRLRVYFAFLSLILYIFTKCSVDLYTGGLFIQQSLKWDLYLSILVLILVTAILTITGGLTAVIYTDTLQAFLMVGGALTLMGMSFWKLGGYGELVRTFPQAIPTKLVANQTCGIPPSNAFQMLKEARDNDMPWAGFLFGQTPGSIWYWCSDQVIVQRALAAKSLSHAQGATLMAGFIKILPLFMMVMPGMISRVFYPNEVACADPEECYKICQSYAGCTNIAYPKLVLGVMPIGLRGLMMAVMIAALMSDLDSIFNSASTLFTIDVWKRFRKQATVRELMIVGRVFVLVMTAVAVAWVPVVKEMQGGQVFIYIQEVTNYLAPPVAAIFILGVVWPRINEQGVFWALMVALLTGVTRLVLVFIWPGAQKCGDVDDRPAIIKDFQYMYFAMLLFWMTVIVAAIVSYCTEAPEEKRLIRTTFWTRHDNRDREEVIMESKSGMHFDDISKATTNSMETGLDNPGLEKGESNSTLDSDKQKPVFTVSAESVNRYNPGNTSDEVEWESRPWYSKACDWLIGIHQSPGESQRQQEQQCRLLKITSLKQSRAAKIGLNIGLVFILSLGVALYCFWSYWQYVP